MTSAEQDYLMSIIAKLKDDGRVEALRENRNHIHIFAFPDGERPDERLIANELNQVGGGKPNKLDNKKARNGKRSLAANNKKTKSSKVARSRGKKSKPVAQSHGARSRGNN
jgi:succinylglutamate desuccinylase